MFSEGVNSALNQDRSEWLEADGLGGFASGTVGGIRTRRYHALLLAATTPPSGRMVLVNGFDAEVEIDGVSLALTTQRYAPGVDVPDGASRLEDFTLDPWPRWTFRLPGGKKIVQEVFVPHEQAAVVLRWRMENSGGAQLHVRPFFSGSDFHATHHENPVFDFTPKNFPTGQRWRFYPGVPPVVARSNGIYEHQPCWYRNFLYDLEAERGLDALEDLAAPGRYSFDLAQGAAVLIFSAQGVAPSPPPDPEIPAPKVAGAWAAAETSRRALFSTPRLRAANAYLVRRGTGKTIIAGYPWFGDWGRDTFIAMRGLFLATGRWAEAREILLAWAGTISQGMLPNRFPDQGDEPEYNSVDAPLWYVVVVCEFLKLAPVETQDQTLLLAAIDSVLTGYRNGTRYGIRGDADGLLACGVPGVQLTWMDAKVGDWVVTPRIGKPVEVQALWLNALGLAGENLPHWTAPYEKAREAFEQRFWNETRGCLYDVVDVDHQPGSVDDRLRPNQVFSLGGLPLAFFEDKRGLRAMRLVREQLWTPMGPRSLAPGEPGYAPVYVGDQRQRDGAYHQGTVWPWLAGPFLEAWVRVNGGTAQARAEARSLLTASQLLRPDLQGLDHVPEIADGNPPHSPRGCPFQAWSVGEILRLELKILRP